MAKKKYDSSEGVWRTIGGRRVFIKTGQSLSDAMKESGKFKTKMNEKAVKGAREEDLKEQYKDSLNNVSKMEYNGEITKEEYDKAVKDINKAYIGKRNEYLKEGKDYDDYWEKEGKKWEEKMDKASRNYDETNYDEEWNAERLDRFEDKFYTRKDGTKEYDPYKGTRFEKKYDSMDDVIKDPNSALNKYISEKKVEERKNNSYIQKLNDKILGNDYTGKGETPSLIYSNGRRIDIVESEVGDKIAVIWKDGKIERKTYLPKNVKGDKTKDYFDKYLADLDSESLKDRYSRTVDYLKQTTNMNGNEILELLKEIDEDKK